MKWVQQVGQAEQTCQWLNYKADWILPRIALCHFQSMALSSKRKSLNR